MKIFGANIFFKNVFSERLDAFQKCDQVTEEISRGAENPQQKTSCMKSFGAFMDYLEQERNKLERTIVQLAVGKKNTASEMKHALPGLSQTNNGLATAYAILGEGCEKS